MDVTIKKIYMVIVIDSFQKGKTTTNYVDLLLQLTSITDTMIQIISMKEDRDTKIPLFVHVTSVVCVCVSSSL